MWASFTYMKAANSGINKALRASPAFSHIRQLFREFLWVGWGQGIAALGGIVGVRLMTTVLSPGIYGELALGMTMVTLTQQVLSGPLSQASLRFYAPAQEANKMGAYVRGVQVLFTQATVILISIAAALGLGLWRFGLAKWLGFICVILAFSLLTGYKSAVDSIQNAARQRAIVAWHQGVGEWLRFLTAIALVSILGEFSSVTMLGYAISSAIVVGSQLIFFRRIFSSSISSSYLIKQSEIDSWVKQMRSYALPFALWGIFTWAQIASDRWALRIIEDTSSVGFYAVLYQIGYYPIALLSGLFMQLISPVLFSWAGDGEDKGRMNRTRGFNNLIVLGSVILTFLGTMLTFLLHSRIFSLLVGPEYRSISYLLPLIVLSGGLFISGQIASQLLLISFDTKRLIVPKIVTAILGISLNFLGAYKLGLLGVVLSGVFFSIIYFVWILFLTKGCSKSFQVSLEDRPFAEDARG